PGQAVGWAIASVTEVCSWRSDRRRGPPPAAANPWNRSSPGPARPMNGSGACRTGHGPDGGACHMSETHFALRRRACPATPDASCYYPATSHEQALSRLLQGLQGGEGLLLLTGAPGTGKTLLCHCLLERLGPDVGSAFLTNTHVRDRAGLLQAILF